MNIHPVSAAFKAQNAENDNLAISADPLFGVRRAINAAYAEADASGNRALKAVALLLLADVARRRRQVGLDDRGRSMGAFR